MKEPSINNYEYNEVPFTYTSAIMPIDFFWSYYWAVKRYDADRLDFIEESILEDSSFLSFDKRMMWQARLAAAYSGIPVDPKINEFLPIASSNDDLHKLNQYYESGLVLGIQVIQAIVESQISIEDAKHLSGIIPLINYGDLYATYQAEASFIDCWAECPDFLMKWLKIREDRLSKLMYYAIEFHLSIVQNN